MTPEQRVQYIRLVWEEFWKRARGPERLMSPAEWYTAWQWREAGIPLRVVIRAMEDSKGTPATLRYYDGPVRAEYERALAALTF